MSATAHTHTTGAALPLAMDMETIRAFLLIQDARRQWADAMWEANMHRRWLCMFNHPIFPGQRFEVNLP